MSAATIPPLFAVGFLGLAVTVASATDRMHTNPVLRAGTSEIECTAESGTTSLVWHIDLDDDLPIATVNDSDAPVDFAGAHVRVRLAANGPNLFIGRVSGRLVIATPEGATLGAGRCTPRPFI
jgi:hypothetical protein